MLLAGFSTPTQAASEKKLAEQIALFVTDPSIIAYLAEEAANAGVSRIRAFKAGENPNGDYGMSTFNSGTRFGEVLIDASNSGGRSVTNFTHEIAHIAAFRRGCFAHGDLWLEYLMAMAKRYEVQFPGKNWGKYSPTSHFGHQSPSTSR
jgi:hypothetical protein